MKGKTLRNFTIEVLLVLLLVFLVIPKFNTNKYQVKQISIGIGNSFEDEIGFSFTEGAELSDLNTQIVKAALDGTISIKEYNQYEKLLDELYDNFSKKNQLRIYKYASKLLKQDLYFYFHDNQHADYFFGGVACTDGLTILKQYYHFGYISKDLLEDVCEVYFDIFQEPNIESIDHFLKLIDLIIERVDMDFAFENARDGGRILPVALLFVIDMEYSLFSFASIFSNFFFLQSYFLKLFYILFSFYL